MELGTVQGHLLMVPLTSLYEVYLSERLNCLNIAIVIGAIVELSNFTCAHQDDGSHFVQTIYCFRLTFNKF